MGQKVFGPICLAQPVILAQLFSPNNDFGQNKACQEVFAPKQMGQTSLCISIYAKIFYLFSIYKYALYGYTPKQRVSKNYYCTIVNRPKYKPLKYKDKNYKRIFKYGNSDISIYAGGSFPLLFALISVYAKSCEFTYL